MKERFWGSEGIKCDLGRFRRIKCFGVLELRIQRVQGEDSATVVGGLGV